ncbi:MAG: class I SAM-dependent methyltransferase [Betaproteobacteria bacterium]|nr:class I SAM-dependent methyltransferase [Betaproteobacteria bacterium]
MRDHYHRRSTCRLCGGCRLLRVLSLTPTPLANAFVPRAALAEKQPVYPLDVFFCEECGHVQLLDVIDPEILYRHYVYVSGTSPVFVHHFEEYRDYVVERLRPPHGALVVDIGSNDGTLLRFFRDSGYRVLGVDPALEITRATIAAGIETIVDFFTSRVVSDIRGRHGPAGVVTANNVISHIDDLGAVVGAVRDLLAPDGVFVFEVSYLADVFEKTLFDTIYHEHLDYHSVKPLVSFFDRCGMELVDVRRVATHGGSLRGVAQCKRGPRDVDPSIAVAVDAEERLGLNRAATFHAFAAHIGDIKRELLGLLRGLKAGGRRIAGFGAPAKTTTLMYHLGLEREMIDFIVDDSPLKQGLYTPGMHIPVLPTEEIYRRRPDYVVILAWNFAGPIIERHGAFRAGGGRFIIPLPAVQVV